MDGGTVVAITIFILIIFVGAIYLASRRRSRRFRGNRAFDDSASVGSMHYESSGHHHHHHGGHHHSSSGGHHGGHHSGGWGGGSGGHHGGGGGGGHH